jgi:beta-barrel assembly-enhancing protease
MQERRREPGLFDTFFASHPIEESRVERTRELIAALDQSRIAALPRDDRGFQQLKAIVASLPPAPRRVELPR